MITLYKGDCLIEMNKIADKSIDMILCDLPYGTTACSWDVVIPFDKLWEQYNRIIKDNGAILLFGTEPFSSALRLSNLRTYKYDLYWKKEKPTNFLQLKKRFGKVTENICVFYKKQCTYNPIKIKTDKYVSNKPKIKDNDSIVSAKGFKNIKPYVDDGTRYPNDILEFNRVPLGKTVHPTQKPTNLLEFLIKSFTNENETVLDNCMGSGSTGVACINTNRNFIGIEQDDNYFEIAKQRIEYANKEKQNQLF
jgi:site-specific DNA-methyltransferase (adenine-specific)